MIALTQTEADARFHLADGTSGDLEVELAFIDAMLLGLRVFKERQRKYGRGNIARSGERGVVIRVGDKLARLENLERSAGAADESVTDTWIDVGNYGFIGLMTHLGTWPGPKEVTDDRT